MEDERSIAKGDSVLRELASNSKFEAEVYSSDEELDLPYENDEASEYIDEMVFREQIKSAKKFFREITELDDGEEDDVLCDLVDEVLDVQSNPSDDLILKPSIKLSDALTYFESAMERNSKMRDKLLDLKQSLLKKKQEFEDMIYALEARGDDHVPEQTEEDDGIVSWGFPAYQKINDGVVFSNKIGLFFNQFLPPYFKDKFNFHCPPTLDAVRQKDESTPSPSLISPSKHWAPQSISLLENAIKKSLIDEFKSKADFKAIYQWREYSSFVKSHSLGEILEAKPPDYKFDWLKIAASMPQEVVRSSNECSKLWDFYLSPKFSKVDWSTEEDDKIIELAKKYDEQEWDKVASELNTDRSAFQIFSYYSSNLRNRVHFGERWTHKEDEYLRNVINGCTYGNFISWKKVMYYCEQRTYTQIYNRWQNNLVCQKKGKFSDKEDRALITALAHGMGYKDTSKALGGKRSSQQIRERLMAIVKFGRDNALNVGDWSEKEDVRLMELIRVHGEKWSMIAKEMGTRDRTQCRHRYSRLKIHMMENPNFDIKLMDRRKRKGYSNKLRSKKRNLLKALGTGSFSQKKKRSFLSELNKILDDSCDAYPNEDANDSKSNSRYKALIKYLIHRGSGVWAPFDLPKASPSELRGIADCCSILDAGLNYDRYTSELERDEHLKSVRSSIPDFKENKMCDISTIQKAISDRPSTSSGTSHRKLKLLPPNQVTCYGFIQSLSFCSDKEKTACKSIEKDSNENDDVKKAKDLFQQRLVQLFLWPAILSCKEKKNKWNTYSSNSINLKLLQNQLQSHEETKK